MTKEKGKDKEVVKFASGGSGVNGDGFVITPEDEKKAKEFREDLVKRGIMRDSKDFKPLKARWDN